MMACIFTPIRPMSSCFGYDSPDDLEGMPIVDLVAKEDLATFKDYLRSYGKGESTSNDLRFHGMRADGAKIDAMMQLSAASYDGRTLHPDHHPSR
jgi:hypothetical protein